MLQSRLQSRLQSLRGLVLMTGCALILGAGAALLAARPAAAGAPTSRLVQDEPPPPKLRPAKPEEKKGATAAIEGQLKAFKEDDFVKAEKFQATELRKNFRSTEDFRRAIRLGYPQFANYKSAVFGDARCDDKGELLIVPVTVTGQDGVVVRSVYTMLKEGTEWKVGSVATVMPRQTDPRDVI